MMHPLHDSIAKLLADKLKARKIVVWYDPHAELVPFVEELCEKPLHTCEPVPVTIAGTPARLAQAQGSLFELRMAVEPLVCVDAPVPLVLYLPGCTRDRETSVLMELERAGTHWEPELKQLARYVLLEKYTLGVVDEMLPFDRLVPYEELKRACSVKHAADLPSQLKRIFHDAPSDDALIAHFLTSDARDEEITGKSATQELQKLLQARLGLRTEEGALPGKLRAIALRYVLGNEFRLDLGCEPPSAVRDLQKPNNQAEETAVRSLAKKLRASHADVYAALADRVEEELGLDSEPIAPTRLGAIDTFRFEERNLLRHATDLLAHGKLEEAQALIIEREQSYWLNRDMARKAQWEAAKRMAELGKAARDVREAIGKAPNDAARWLSGYVEKGGWYRLDQAQRRLEGFLSSLDEDPDEKALGVVRRAYEDTCHAMAEGFFKALSKARWAIPGALHQTRIFGEIVHPTPKPVAFFLVDAMRFEMGVELGERLPKTTEVTLKAAIAALPTITPIGMAALLPGASASFSVVEQGGKPGARIEDSFLPDLAARKKHAAARVPKLVDLALDELLGLQPSKLAKKVEGAPIVIIRSQEIDHAGETGFTFQARQVMDNVIDNLARALRKLANVGIEHAVITADHGHLFFATDRDESMRTDAPGGKTVDLHRRCWIGRGGRTPTGCERVTAGELGYSSDLDFVFPTGSGVMRAGGDLAFHHGGTSLQEMVIPVLVVRTPRTDLIPKAKQGASKQAPALVITSKTLPDAITNRIFSVTFDFGEKQMTLGQTLLEARPLLMAEGRQVGGAEMVVDAELDRSTGCVKLDPNRPISIVFFLRDDSAKTVRVILQDPTTDREIYRSPSDIPVRLGV